jgi:hypothetical protein
MNCTLVAQSLSFLYSHSKRDELQHFAAYIGRLSLMGRPERVGFVYAGTHQDHRYWALIATLVRDEVDDSLVD